MAGAARIVSQFGFPKENGTGLVTVISQMRRGAQEVEGTCPKSHDPPWPRWNWNSGVVQQSIEHLSLSGAFRPVFALEEGWSRRQKL